MTTTQVSTASKCVRNQLRANQIPRTSSLLSSVTFLPPQRAVTAGCPTALHEPKHGFATVSIGASQFASSE